jgi:hypothetical protein
VLYHCGCTQTSHKKTDIAFGIGAYLEEVQSVQHTLALTLRRMLLTSYPVNMIQCTVYSVQVHNQHAAYGNSEESVSNSGIMYLDSKPGM